LYHYVIEDDSGWFEQEVKDIITTSIGATQEKRGGYFWEVYLKK
jgi:hypothetical protein